jgi:FKBP-type peptidyl-prolyl cis-trans isomerase FkpA
MKNWLFTLLISTLFISSCSKDKASDCNATAPAAVASASETAYLQTYLNAQNITNATAKNGMFYVISTQGSGMSPNLCSTITTTYTGTLINGTSDGAVFDGGTGVPASFSLNQLIYGWQIVMPLVKAGGTVTLYIPPSLGYGATPRTNSAGVVVIPANSYLKFVINLSNVQ